MYLISTIIQIWHNFTVRMIQLKMFIFSIPKYCFHIWIQTHCHFLAMLPTYLPQYMLRLTDYITMPNECCRTVLALAKVYAKRYLAQPPSTTKVLPLSSMNITCFLTYLRWARNWCDASYAYRAHLAQHYIHVASVGHRLMTVHLWPWRKSHDLLYKLVARMWVRSAWMFCKVGFVVWAKTH